MRREAATAVFVLICLVEKMRLDLSPSDEEHSQLTKLTLWLERSDVIRNFR
jgi:hypothetical protein